MFPKQITKEELNELPLKRYEGKVSIITEVSALARAIQHIREYDILGFDTETKPAFRKGVRHMVSLLQIAIPDMVYLVRLNHLGFTRELSDLFSDARIKKVGISIRDDLKHLEDLSSKYRVSFVPDNIVELNEVASELGVENAGVKKLTGIFMNFRVSKSQQTTNWENPQLTEKQVRYAATDAWVCLEIYQRLQKLGYV